MKVEVGSGASKVVRWRVVGAIFTSVIVVAAGLVWILVGSRGPQTAALGGYSPYAIGTAKIVPEDVTAVASPQLQSGDGLTSSGRWSLLAAANDPLDVTSPSGQGTSEIPTASLIGLEGSLYQLWVPTDAYTEYGGLAEGIQLPLPQTYAQQYPGPNEVVVQVYQFSSNEDAQSMLTSPSVSLASIASRDSAYVVVSGAGIGNGVAAQVTSDSLAGYENFVYQWTSGDYWIQVSVVGANMTVQSAASVAALVAPPS